MADEDAPAGVYLYCVVGEEADPSDVTGIGGGRVRALPLSGIRVWASALERAPHPHVQRMREHNAVVTAALDAGDTPVPLRFGQWFSDERQALDALRPRLDALRASLARVRDSVEYGIRVIDPAATTPVTVAAPPEAPAPSGRAYIERAAARIAARDRARRSADEVATALDQLVGPLVRERKVEPLRSRSGVATIAHLVARADETDYLERVRAIRGRLPEYRFLFTGPWPPYSFGP
ncbi:MAG: GvpL/GvpF family gas vesicle protein [Longimicrobiales bacterium]